jgi:hypothetical protein
LVESRTAPFGRKEALVTFQANLAGAQVTQTIGPLRQALTSENEAPAQQRFLLVTQSDNDAPELIQQER